MNNAKLLKNASIICIVGMRWLWILPRNVCLCILNRKIIHMVGPIQMLSLTNPQSTQITKRMDNIVKQVLRIEALTRKLVGSLQMLKFHSVLYAPKHSKLLRKPITQHLINSLKRSQTRVLMTRRRLTVAIQLSMTKDAESIILRTNSLRYHADVHWTAPKQDSVTQSLGLGLTKRLQDR